MERLNREFSTNGDRWISIHDMHLSKISCLENSVVFCFEDGFNLIENTQLFRKSKGYIELFGCNYSDFSCSIFERRITKKGTKLYGRPISLEELNRILVSEKKCVEIFLELYDFNHLYWRGELLPHKTISKKNLAPLITIEAMEFFPMMYLWE